MGLSPTLRSIVLIASALLSARSLLAQNRTVAPILGFPEAGIDDPAAYQGYQTRFFRDTKGNVVQIYLDATRGRVVLPAWRFGRVMTCVA